MDKSPSVLSCDGCGLPASPEHIAERVRRLELSTRFRPVHISVLFVALAPPVRPEDDFYGPSASREYFDPFMDALGIFPLPGSDAAAGYTARFAEFQHRGYHLAYLSECPLPANEESAASTIARLAPTLIRRIRFNYKPKHVAPLGLELFPLIGALRAAGIAPILTLGEGQPLPVPRTGGGEWLELFQRAVESAAPRDNLSSGYDRIPLTPAERDLEAGGNS